MLNAALLGLGLTYVPEGLAQPHIAKGRLSLTLANSEQAYRPCGMRNMGSLSTIS